MHATQIILRNLASSAPLRNRIRDLSLDLDRHHPRLQLCRIEVENAGRAAPGVRAFEVRVEVRVPGREAVATRRHDDVKIALLDAFEIARRELRAMARSLPAAERVLED